MPTEESNSKPQLSNQAKAGFGIAIAVAVLGITDLSDADPFAGVDYLVVAGGMALYYFGMLRNIDPLRIAGGVVAVAGIALVVFSMFA